jgi:hypothetical protein
VLDDVVSLMTTAERTADRIADLCRRGEAVDNELVGLTAAVSGVVAQLPDGVPPDLHLRWLALSERVAAATASAERRQDELSAELEGQARFDRIRRAYVRPPV